MTIQEFWSALTVNTKEKIKNPFFGSLALVWIFYHHSEIYQLLFCYQDHKTEMNYLNAMFAVDWILVLLLLKAIGVMIVSYVLLTLTNYGVTFYTNRMTPWIQDKASKGALVVDKTKYDNLQKEYTAINEKHENLIEQRNHAVSKRLELQEERDSAVLKTKEAHLEKATAIQNALVIQNAQTKLIDDLASANDKAKAYEQSMLDDRRLKEVHENNAKSAMKDLQNCITVGKEQQFAIDVLKKRIAESENEVLEVIFGILLRPDTVRNMTYTTMSNILNNQPIPQYGDNVLTLLKQYGLIIMPPENPVFEVTARGKKIFDMLNNRS